MQYSDTECYYIVNLVNQIGAKKRQHINVDGAFSVPSVTLQARFGETYKEKTDFLFNVVSDNYCYHSNGKSGITKAYTLKQSAIDLVKTKLAEPSFMKKMRKVSRIKKLTHKNSNAVVSTVEWYNISKVEALILEQDKKAERLRKELCLVTDSKECLESQLTSCELLSLYLKSILSSVDENGMNIVTYEASKQDVSGQGRLFAQGPSMQALPDDIRKYVAGKDYTNCDVVNCHPRILFGLVKKTGAAICLDKLSFLIKNRETVIKNIMAFYNVNRSFAKKLILQIQYGASLSIPRANGYAINEWIVASGASVRLDKEDIAQHMPFLISLRKEFKECSNVILKLPEFQDLLIEVKADARTKISALSMAVGRIERKIVDFCTSRLLAQGYEISTLIFDGFHVDGAINANVIMEIEKSCKKYLQDLGYDIEINLTTELVFAG